MLKQVVEKVQGTLFLPLDDYSPPKETVKQTTHKAVLCSISVNATVVIKAVRAVRGRTRVRVWIRINHDPMGLMKYDFSLTC